MKLQGRTALVTGAGRRIGRAISLELARGGANIIIHYRSARHEAESLKRMVESLRCKATLVKKDFSSPTSNILPQIKSFVKSIYQTAPRIDILVNNASVFYPTPFGKISEKDWEEMMTVNLKVPFFLSQEIGKRMAAGGGGKIINLADWVGERPAVNFIPYAISKAGLIAATRGLARALAPKVQVTAMAPGPILPAEGMPAKYHKAAVKRTLLKRFGDPADIANAVRFLIEGSDYVTGSVLTVDGGACIA